MVCTKPKSFTGVAPGRACGPYPPDSNHGLSGGNDAADSVGRVHFGPGQPGMSCMLRSSRMVIVHAIGTGASVGRAEFPAAGRNVQTLNAACPWMMRSSTWL